MTSLVVCSVCQRHVRGHERECPFCGAQRQPTPGASREGQIARDATRATLIALGLTLAGHACGAKTDSDGERDNVGLVPPYGLVPAMPGAQNGGSANAGTGGGMGNAGAGDAAGEGGSVATVPPYGAMPPPVPDDGSGGSANTPDSGTPPDAGQGEGDAGGSETPDTDAGD